MTQFCTIELHAGERWHAVGSVSLNDAANRGWRAPTYSGYDVGWAVSHAGRRDAHAFASGFAVGIEPFDLPHWPVFLIDMLPQGFGREELLRRLNLPVTAAESADWPLLCSGAGNPIGHLRIREAAQWLAGQDRRRRGFTDAEVAERSDDFAEYLAAHGLFVAGSSGVQGEWPKVLLTRAADGLLYLDHTVPDTDAREHFIVKFGRGTDPALASILRHEAPYMAIAAQLGLRVHAPLTLKSRALFIPRFDRRVHARGVERLAQESIATLTGLPGFGAVPSHDQVCTTLAARVGDVEAELLEYLKRDVANVALGNKDNHARNTAIQRDFAGGIRLAPLYDFAPMYLHPDGIARRIRWEDAEQGGRPDWSRVIDRVVQIAAGKAGRDRLVQGVRAMAPILMAIAEQGSRFHLDDAVHRHLRPGLVDIADQLARLH